MFELLKKLCGTGGVSGNEEAVRSLIIEEIRDYADEYRVDTLGNLIAVKKAVKSDGGKKIMLAAHMDEIGIIATHIDDHGFVRFAGLGWVSQYFALGQRVRFANGTAGAVFYEEKLEEMKNLKLSNLYLDIGADNREDAVKKVRVGDVACFERETVREGDRVISKALDDRCGCAVLIRLLQELPSIDNEIHFVFTVQEELGLRGAKTAAFQVLPDLAVAVDVTDTGDTPECETMEVRCGAGPAIKIKDKTLVCHPDVRRLLEDSARAAGVPFQYEVLERGGSDPGAIHLVAGGIPSGAVSIPCRYIHSPVETISLSDMENAVKLLKTAVTAKLP